MADIQVENIVATTHLANHFDIQHLASLIKDCKYDPNEFSGLALNFRHPKTAALIFPSGRIVCTGAKNMDQLEDLINRAIDQIERAGSKIPEEPEVEIQNIIATSHINKTLDLVAVAKSKLIENVKFNPEKFPGLIIKMDNPRAVVLLFASGKIVCTGTKNLEDASLAINSIKEKLRSFGAL
ncbi:MAG: TATA-box-binding protein [Candidatus Thermoplasmatota archaeon]|nr:TATA-box-binding protein [Candidatus Thermoplasmatota archaeon]